MSRQCKTGMKENNSKKVKVRRKKGKRAMNKNLYNEKRIKEDK